MIRVIFSRSARITRGSSLMDKTQFWISEELSSFEKFPSSFANFWIKRFWPSHSSRTLKLERLSLLEDIHLSFCHAFELQVQVGIEIGERSRQKAEIGISMQVFDVFAPLQDLFVRPAVLMANPVR